MSSISGILNMARTALLTHQAAMGVAGHNIANAETPGYTRQDLLLGTGPSRVTVSGVYGTGVRTVTVGRARESLLDQDVRAQLAPASYSSTRRDALLGIERVFGEPSPSGLAAAFDEFWNSWSDLAAQPTNAGARTVVRQRAVALTDRFNTYASELQRIETATRSRAQNSVDAVNRLSEDIARINAQIVPAESGGHTANDLRDQRDRLLDELGSIVPVTVIDRADGSNQVMLGGRPLVDGVSTNTLTLHSGAITEVRVANEPSAVRTMGGTLGADVDLLNGELTSVRQGLDALAAALVADVNALHMQGWSPTAGAGGNWDPLLGPTGSGIAFFDTDPLAATASGLRLSSAIDASAAAIAAGGIFEASGDNSIALALAEMRNGAPSPAGQSFGAAWQSIISSVAGAARTASDATTVNETLLQQSRRRRESTSGVSTDEELMRLMRHQQAYTAAAKVVQTVDEMMEVLIGLKR